MTIVIRPICLFGLAPLLKSICLLVCVLAIQAPEDAFCQTRNWSTRPGKPSFWKTPAPNRKIYIQTPETEDSGNLEAAANPSRPTPQQSEGRAALRYEWSPDGISDTDETSAKNDAVNQEGVTVELFIDGRTRKRIEAVSKNTGIPFKKLLYEFLRKGSYYYY